jgi:hypothetical protein
MQNELNAIRQHLPPGDDGFCRCNPDELAHTSRDEADVICSTCGLEYRHCIIEVVINSREELEQFYRDHPNDALGQI